MSHSGLGSDPGSAAEAAGNGGGEGHSGGDPGCERVGLRELGVVVEGFLEEGPRACPTHAPALSSCLLRKSEGNEPPSLILARAKLTFLEFCELCVDLGVVVASSSRAPPSAP